MKTYKLDFNFKNGDVWKDEELDLNMTMQQVIYIIEELESGEKELENILTGEKRPFTDLKSIEIRM